MCRVLNSHCFPMVGDVHQPNSRIYIPIIRIPIKGGMTIPNIRSLDCGTYISRNLDGSKAKLRNTRSPCRSIHRHTETEVILLFSGMCWGSSYSKPQEVFWI